jgi:hypothetical protein
MEKKQKTISRKAQLDIMQTAFVIIFAFLVLIVAFFFVMSIYTKDLKTKVNQGMVLDGNSRYQTVNFLPELKCTQAGVYDYECYDLQKIRVFRAQADSDIFYYKDIFGYVKFSISIPPDEELIINNSKPDFLTKTIIRHPILIYDNEKKEMREGELNLEIYD